MDQALSPDVARARLAEHPGWYHTMDLLPGVATQGYADLRDFLPKALPDDLSGKRCLDIGTFDGFWAFAMEDRGASSVVGIDVESTEQLEHPPLKRAANVAAAHASGIVPGQGFRLAKEIKGSKVERVACNVYDLTPEKIGGKVDFVLVGTILQHLRQPVTALERVRDVLNPGGVAVIVETIQMGLTVRHPRRPVGEFRAASPHGSFTWTVANLALLKAWPTAVGMPPTGKKVTMYKPKNVARGDWVAALEVKPSGVL
jgi:2-polyprenyl-3-methyl-5-hydroxy-6-metoxy-1,4-benzoquinol methylase